MCSLRLSLLLCVVGLFAGCAETGVVRSGPARLLPGRIVVQNVVGPANVMVVATSQKLNLQDNMELSQGQVVSTEANASVTLLFTNGTMVNVAPQSALDLESFTQLPAPGMPDLATLREEPSTSQTRLTLLRGRISGRVPQLHAERGSSLVIRRGTEDLSFNGTNFDLSAP